MIPPLRRIVVVEGSIVGIINIGSKNNTRVLRGHDRTKRYQADTLEDASIRLEMSWGDRRGAKSDSSQLRRALDTLIGLLGPHTNVSSPAEVTERHVSECVAVWQAESLSNATINKRLCVLSAMGINAQGNWQRDKSPLKWWLHPDKGEKLLTYLRSDPAPFRNAVLTADYVEWAMMVGMRVEESLRLTWGDVHLSFEQDAEAVISHTEVTVPGTKTSGAQASIAIALRPALVLQRRYEARAPREQRVFAIHYDQLHDCWAHCRKFLGVTDNPLATLRALRRTSARHLTTKGMPLDIVRQYLRHRDIKTTLGYLRLVGGYTTEEQRKWL